MNKIYTKLLLVFNKITGNIAFYPTIISLAGFLLSILVLSVDNPISKIINDRTPFLVINDASTARTMLSTFIGGNTSLMVFSFSMVMLLLNKASSSYSPRILPGLIANKQHQQILGYYLGVIIYTIIVLLSVKPVEDKSELPGFAILVAIILSMGVLAAFIYFIHSISQSIQINNIIDRLYHTASARLQHLIDKEKDYKNTDLFDDADSWEKHCIEDTGYLNDIALDSLVKFAEDNDCLISILNPKGTFILVKMPIVAVNIELSKEQKENLMACFSFSKNEIVNNNYILSFKQLTEIAVKSMSPGINDPATAITCLNYLTQLFVLRLQKKDKSYVSNKDNDLKISLTTIDFDELTYFVFASLREYCKRDFIVVYKMLCLLITASQADMKNESYRKSISLQRDLIMEDAEKNIENSEDLQRLKYLSTQI